jgi:hypothetical protein
MIIVTWVSSRFSKRTGREPRAQSPAAAPFSMRALTASLTLLTGAMLVSVGLISVAVAQEYCVQCAEPPALYRCVIDGARPGVVPSLQLLCVQRMATQGGHASCSVKRGVTVFDCDAPVKRVAVTDSEVAPAGALTGSGPSSGSIATIPATSTTAPSVAPTSGVAPVVSAPTAPAKIQDGSGGPVGAISRPAAATTRPDTSAAKDKAALDEPKTVLEVAKRAQAATDKEMHKTGVGFKKAWDCFASLFKRCGDTAD